MNIVVLYFSGTGNTKFIAEKIEDNLKQLSSNKKNNEFEQVESLEVKTFAVDKIDLDKRVEDIKQADLLIIGYPVYACDMPLFMKNMLKQLKNVENKGLIIYCTMGLFSGNSLRNSIKILKGKGYKTLYFEDIKMPGSDGMVFMKKDSKYVRNILDKDFDNDPEINQLIKHIGEKTGAVAIKGIKSLPEEIPGFKATGMILDKFMKLIYGVTENRFKKKFYADKDCIRCGLCEGICPSGNIIVSEDGVEFQDKCFLCMRCINQCPTEAIQIGKMTRGKFRYKGPEC